MGKFLTDTIEQRFIKALLYNTPLPLYRTVKDGDVLIEGNVYVYKASIIKCTSSGTLGDKAEYSIIDEYSFGEKYVKITDTFNSKNNYYDTDTHIRLGKYLRCLRDIYDIDLMHLYNCYSNKFASNAHLSSEGVDSSKWNKIRTEVIEVPIRFNQDYTIAIDCPSSVILCPAFILNGDLVTVLDDSISEYLWTEDNIKTYSSLSFHSPITYRIDNTDANLSIYEKDLKLLIQVPYELESSFVILEGDYTDIHRQVIDISALDELAQDEQNEYFLSKPQLLKMNDKVTYAYSDRLIEYLLGNVITSLDETKYDIQRVQEAVNADDYFDYQKDIWDDKLRFILYTIYMNKYPDAKDINGFVDKDIEKYLRKLSV